MDSPIISRLFRQLFTHRPCQSLLAHSSVPFRIHGARHGRRTQVRCVSGGGDGMSRNDSHWQQRTELFPMDMSAEYDKYPMVTADQLRGRRERPRRVKMLMRDFIEGTLALQGSDQDSQPSQTLCIIPHMGTSRNKWLFLHRESHLTSTIFRMNRNSTVCLDSDTLNSRINWTSKNPMTRDSYGIHPPSSFVRTMEKP